MNADSALFLTSSTLHKLPACPWGQQKEASLTPWDLSLGRAAVRLACLLAFDWTAGSNVAGGTLSHGNP